MTRKCAKLFTNIIYVIFGIIVSWLFLAALLTTTTETMEYRAMIYLTKDSLLSNIILLLAVFALIALIVFLYNKNEIIKEKLSSDKTYSLIRKICYILIFAEAFTTVLALRLVPCADQAEVMGIASGWIHGNFSAYNPGGYLDIFPFQEGVILFCYYLWQIFGENNYIVFQLLNGICIIAIYRVFEKILGFLDVSRNVKLYALILGVLFLPLNISVSYFVYGSIIGFTAALMAFEHVLEFNASNKNRYLFLTLIETFFAIMVKENYMIATIALIIYELIYILKTKVGVRHFLLIIGLSILLLFTSKIVSLWAYTITGVHAGEGEPMSAWFAMGLQENPDRKYDGWYNGYNTTTYLEYLDDRDAWNDEAVQYLTGRIQEFKADPIYAIKFFAGKNASQWNAPTFQIPYYNYFYISEAGADIAYPQWVKAFFYEQDLNKIRGFLNGLQLLILAFALVDFATRAKSKDDLTNSYIYIYLTIIGGFIFHSFSEANGTYTLFYFVLLIPCAARGVYTTQYLLQERILVTNFDINELFSAANIKRNYVAIAMAAFCLCMLAFNKAFGDCLFQTAGTDTWNTYLAKNTYEKMDDGEYSITSVTLGLPLDIGDIEYNGRKIVLSDNTLATVNIVPTNEKYYYIQFLDSDYAYNVPENDEYEGQRIEAAAISKETGQRFYFVSAGQDDEYYILSNNGYALGWGQTNNRLEISEFDFSEDQVWKVEKYCQ